MKKHLILWGLVVCLEATTNPHANTGRAFQTVRYDINNIEMVLTNYGQFAIHENGSDPGFWWPMGSMQTYIRGAGIWVGTIDSAGDTLVTIGYGLSGGQFEFAPGRSGWSVGDPDAVIFMYPGTWPSVPPDRLADIFPPKILSHQDSWCVYNDSNPQYHMADDTKPIGIEVYQTVYAWNYPGLEDAIFLTFEIKNVSGYNLRNCYVGICTDNDIGNEAGAFANDIFSAIIGQWFVFDGESLWIDNLAYQWQEDPEPGWDPAYPGVIGFDFLRSPYDLQEGADKDADGILDQYEMDSAYYWNVLPPDMWDVDNDGVPDWRDPSEIPQHGLTALKRFHLDLEPGRDNERYLSLAGFNFVTGVYEPYDTIPCDPDDQRWLMSSGPFNLEPESSVMLALGIMLADWVGIYQTPDTAIVLVDYFCQFTHDMNWLVPGTSPPPRLTCVPGDAHITLVWDTSAEIAPDPYFNVLGDSTWGPYDPFYKQFDFEGYGVWKSLDRLEWELLQRYDSYNDIVFDDPETGIYATNSGLLHYHVDNNVRNGFTYYYAVTSFDYNYMRKIIGSDTVAQPFWLESNKVSVAAIPRREPANYQPGTYSVTALKGNPILADSNVGVFITYPLHMTDEPFYLEFGPIVYDEGYPRYSASLFDADETIIDSVKITLPVAEQTFHDFGTHHGLSISAVFRREDIPANTSIFDRVEVSGYPDTLVVLGTMPQNWAYRGNDYELHWIKAYGSDSVNSVVVIDRFVGDTIPFNTGDDSLAQCWCFRSLTQSTDTLVYGGIPDGTRSLYICGGKILLNRGQHLGPGDPRPHKNAVWILYANRDYLPAPANARIQITPTPARLVTEVEKLNVKVVPNPYIIANEWQQSFIQRRMRFINLPGECTIRIFNLNGELVRSIKHYHTSGDGVLGDLGGDEWWDLLNEYHELVASGVYIFHIDSDVGEQVGKFVIIR